MNLTCTLRYLKPMPDFITSNDSFRCGYKKCIVLKTKNYIDFKAQFIVFKYGAYTSG